MQTPTAANATRLDFATVWLVGVACAALSIVVAAMAALNTALPDIAPTLQASSNQMTWIIDGYTLCLAALLLPAGAFGDRMGRRGVLIAGMVVFAIASLLPLWVNDPTMFIATRCLAGVGAAMVMPSTLSLISSGVPEEKRPLAVSVWAGVAGIGAIAGFFVTGMLLEAFSWHSIFITFAASATLVAVLTCTIPTSKDSNPSAFDWLGSVTSAVAIAIFVFGLIEAPQRGWLDPMVLTALFGGIALACMFIWLQINGSRRLIDVKLFANRAFGSASFSVALQYVASFGTFFVILQRFQLVMGYSPLQSAVALLPLVIVMMASTLLGNWFAVHVNLRSTLAGGIVIAGIGLISLGAFDNTEYWQVCAALCVMAVGIGLATAPSTTAIMMNTPEDNHGIGSAVNDTARELGAAIGIALAGSIVAAGYSTRIGETADAARDQVDRTAAAFAGTEQGQQISAQADQMHEYISRSLPEAMAVSEQAAAQGQTGLAAQIAEGAQQAFLAPMGQATVILGGVLLAGGILLAWWVPNAITPEPVEQPEELAEPVTV
jgi:DHA2 family multidrug resistance protein-like MFS transporter